MNRRERRVAARKSPAASKNGASTPAALHEAGLGHLRAGRHLDAQVCCQRALALNAGHADTLQLMGLLSLHAKQYDAAIEWVGRANRADPKTDYLASLGTALEQQGLHEEALKAFDHAVQIRPADAELWTRLANVLVLLQRSDQAILSYQHALKLEPRYWYAVYNYAALLLRLKRFKEALVYLNLCNELQPNHAATLKGRGEALHNLNRFEEALSDNRQAQALDPTNADICSDIGAALYRLSRHEEALEWYDRALDLRPNFAWALNNKAVTLGEIHRFDEAVAVFRHIKRIDPDNAEADWNVALIQLLTGDFETGWAAREARWKIPSFWTGYYPEFSEPAWFGADPIAGKTILLGSDEGLGDAIQLARYVPMVAARGARVILVVPAPLCTLLSGLTGVSQCLPQSAGARPAFDFHCPLSRLPLAFGTRLDTIPAGTSYLPAPAAGLVQGWEARLEARLGPHTKLRVGLVWSGRTTHTNDYNRSIPLRTISRILDVGATFISLQKDPRPDDRATLLERSELVDLTADLTDFAETAALISCLDLVISVDTSVAHLAAALGCPTWILLPYTPDYRWLLDRDDSPWYPSVRLFRQTETREYESVLERVRTELLRSQRT
jgi:tetratricopeptide (TPR) repeat protein